MKGKMIRLGLILPCYNEEEVLPDSFARLSDFFNQLIAEGRISRDSFMLFVNDGSRDATWQLIQARAKEDSRVRGVSLARNVGSQLANLAGLLTVRDLCDAAITMDVDLQDSPDAVREMIDRAAEGYDVVYGVKVCRKADPWLKRTTAVAFYKMQRLMGVDAIYNHSEFRLLSHRAIAELAEYPERNFFLRGVCRLLGLRQTTVDDVISERQAGASKYNFTKLASLAIDGITAFSAKPILFIIYLGIAFQFIGVLMAVYILVSFFEHYSVSGWASIMLSMWLIGGSLMLSVGIIGLYIAKIYTEVKRRPLYHIAEAVGLKTE